MSETLWEVVTRWEATSAELRKKAALTQRAESRASLTQRATTIDSMLDDLRALLAATTQGQVITLPLAAVLAGWQDGNEHGWDAEFAYLRTEHSEKIDRLANSAQQDGILEPVLLGDDGRVWDGHHRLCVADMLALRDVPARLIRREGDVVPQDVVPQ